MPCFLLLELEGDGEGEGDGLGEGEGVAEDRLRLDGSVSHSLVLKSSRRLLLGALFALSSLPFPSQSTFAADSIFLLFCKELARN